MSWTPHRSRTLRPSIKPRKYVFFFKSAALNGKNTIISSALIIISFISLQVVRNQVQWLHGENRPHGVCDACPGVRLPPELLLLLRVRPPAEEGRRVCPERGSAALQDWLREGERLTQLCQPGWLRLRWAFCTLSHRSENNTVVLSSNGTKVLDSVCSVPSQLWPA